MRWQLATCTPWVSSICVFWKTSLLFACFQEHDNFFPIEVTLGRVSGPLTVPDEVTGTRGSIVGAAMQKRFALPLGV